VGARASSAVEATRCWQSLRRLTHRNVATAKLVYSEGMGADEDARKWGLV